MTFIKRDSIILRAIKEDEESDANAIMNGSMTSGNDYDNTSNDSNNTTTEDDTSTEDNTNIEDTNTDNNDDNGGDDDFNIDTSLDGTDDSSDDSSSSDSSTTYSSETNDDGGVNDANTDIYSSLTAEEQAQKIMELKNQYKELYTNCNELLIKFNNVDIEGNQSIIAFSRVSKTIYNLKNYIKDYFINTFPYNSIIQNDIMYNRFLTIFSDIPKSLEEIKRNSESERKES
jgi:hypothetical protein